MTYFSFASQGKILFLSNPSSTQNNQPVWRYRVIPALFTACLAGMLVSNAQAARPLASPALAAAASQPTIYGPIVITSGGTYSGTLISDNTQIPAVTIETDEPVVITNSTITSKGPLISIAGTGTGANVTITNTTGIGLDPGVKGQQRGVFLTANNVSSLVVQNTSVSGTSFGVKVLSSTVANLNISNNLAIHLEDRESNGQGGLLAARPDLGHFIILNAVSAPHGAQIGWNKLVNTIGDDSTEDVINLYKSQGTAATPIVVHDNYMEGYSSTTTPSYSGSGVIADGNQTAPFTAFALFENNDMVHTAGSGVDISSGHNIVATGNRVVSCGLNTNGTWFAMPFANAVSIWNYYGSAQFDNNTISGTVGGLVRPGSSGSAIIADSWINPPDAANGNTLSSEAFANPCIVNSQVNMQAETAERNYWSSKVAAARELIGDQHENSVD
jgi:hypothetical protein